MPPNKYRGVTHPLIFFLILPILLILYFLAFCISLIAFVGYQARHVHVRVLLCCCCCCGKCFMNGLLVIADSLVEACNRVIEGSMCINDVLLTPDDLQYVIRQNTKGGIQISSTVNKYQQFRSLSYPSRSTNQPVPLYYPQNQLPMLVPSAQMPINPHGNMVNQDRNLQHYPQNQLPMLVPSAQLPINRHGNMVNQKRNLQQLVNSPSSVNTTIDYPRSGFTYEELVEATNGFSALNFLGEGGFGFVHRGILSDGKEVAIKQLKSDSMWGQREFKAEVVVLSRVHHRHLVQYIGCCMTQDKWMIVCEYIPNKTVDYHLHGKHEDSIDWDTRLKISIGAAKGLAYLHEECQPRIIHRDIKAANILVDSSFEAKLADLVMAKNFPDGISLVVATNLVGTRGYLAPEFSMEEIREKSDTFSFGVVLLELITGKKPIITHPVFSEESYPFETLANWARPMLTEALQNGNYDSLVDSRLCNIYNYDEMNRMIACAASCVQLSPQDRPLMSKVALVLVGQTSPDDLFIRGISDVIHTASISSMEFQESSESTN